MNAFLNDRNPTPSKAYTWALLLAIILGFSAAWGQQQPGEEEAGEIKDRQAILLDVQDAIGPATRDFIIRALEEAADREAELVIIRLDTPGGLDASTRDIVKAILNSPVPVVTFVAPEGARAASAGTFILLASHIAAMSPATNVGAATPVSIVGGTPAPESREPEKDSGGESDQEQDNGSGTVEEDAEPAESPGDAMSRKAVNDAVAYIRGLAEKHGRNADWAEDAVRDADSITAAEALELGVIDLIASEVSDLLDQIHGMTVELDGFYGLILEGYHPGAILPGVVGAICLLMALYAFQLLPVNYAGLGLIILGIILIIGEALAPSFGALGFGGVIAIVIGSIILIDTDIPGFVVSRALIGAIALVSSLGLMAIIAFAVKARQRPIVAGREEMVGAIGMALAGFEASGHVFVHGERWSANTETPLREGQSVLVTAVDGLTLKVRPVED
jgi:membrane-bound serine protease (ClpP class)